jgi:hypothetical protein
MTETQLKKKVLAMVKKKFPDVWCYKVADKFCAGLPDIILCVPDNERIGRFAGIELKRPGAKPRPLQSHIIEKINDAGGVAICADSVKQCEDFLLTMKGGD